MLRICYGDSHGRVRGRTELLGPNLTIRLFPCSRRGLRVRLHPRPVEIHTATPHTAPRRDGALLQTPELEMIALVVFMGGDLGVSLTDELGVHKQAIHIHVGQEAAVFVTATFVELEADGLP